MFIPPVRKERVRMGHPAHRLVDNYFGGVESVWVRGCAVSVLCEVLGYGEDFVYRCKRLGLRF